MSVGHQVKEAAPGPRGTQGSLAYRSFRTGITRPPTTGTQCDLACCPLPHCLYLHKRIQFSSPSLFLGGPGMFSRTNRASWERVTMTSLSFTAVCMRRTLDWSLPVMQMIMGPTPGLPTELACPHPTSTPRPQCGWVCFCCTHGLIWTSSRKLSGAWLGSQGSAAIYLSRVHVIWILSAPAADSSSSSEYRLSSRKAECRSLTSWA